MKEYLKLFIDQEYPKFLDKYLTTKTLKRIQHVTFFCGCDYTKLYSPLFMYTRFDHSLVVAHMTWHFTHDKKETIAALLHDVGTPCFAHCIDYVFGDYMNQESSEKSITEIIKKDKELISYLKKDGISIEDLEDYTKYPILENKSPKLCTDRLDGVLSTCYIWLHTHNIKQIKEVYDNIVVLQQDNTLEIGFKDIEIAEKFVSMVFHYAKELQGNKDKYVMKYVSEVVKFAFEKKLITLEDLYLKQESDICKIFESNISSWKKFHKLSEIVCTNEIPANNFFVSLESKKRNTIPLVESKTSVKRITEVSTYAKEKYDKLKNFHDTKYAYAKEIAFL